MGSVDKNMNIGSVDKNMNQFSPNFNKAVEFSLGELKLGTLCTQNFGNHFPIRISNSGL